MWQVFYQSRNQGYIKEFATGKSLLNVNSVASVLAKQET